MLIGAARSVCSLPDIPLVIRAATAAMGAILDRAKCSGGVGQQRHGSGCFRGYRPASSKRPAGRPEITETRARCIGDKAPVDDVHNQHLFQGYHRGRNRRKHGTEPLKPEWPAPKSKGPAMRY